MYNVFLIHENGSVKNCEEEIEIVTYTITIEEYCVFPYRNNNLKLIRKVNEFIEDMQIELKQFKEI